MKIELAIKEKDITQRNKCINAVLYVGILLICIFAPFKGIEDAEYDLVVNENEKPTWLKICVWIFIFLMFVNFCFLVDALIRLSKTKVSNKTISSWAVAVFCFTYATQVAVYIMFIFKVTDWNIIVSTVALSGGLAILATILHLIGTST